jgi:hypothetical protein
MPNENENPAGQIGSENPQAPAVKPTETVVPTSLLEDIQTRLNEAEIAVEQANARTAGLEEMLAASKGADALGEKKLREKKNYEPKFRTVRLRKFPIAGDITNPGYVIGWTKRGAYQEVDRTGVSPQVVDYIDIIFLGHEKTAEGKLQAEKVRLLDLLNKGEQVNVKILKTVREDIAYPTGEEIHVTSWDPQHGLVDTGETVDGFYKMSDITYTVDIPGTGAVEINGEFVN